MADNVPVTAGTGTTIATDDIGGVHFQRVKVTHGADGTATDASAANPLPVSIASPATVPVSLASVPSHAVTNAGTFAVQVSSAIPAGTNNIGDVDVLTIGGQTPALGAGATTAGTQRTALASDSPGVMTWGKYETVAASQTAQVIGSTGATGDHFLGLLVIPATTSPGTIAILDNATSITVFAGGTNSVSNLVPFFIPLNMKSVSGAWKVTTGANVSAIAVGNFT